MPHDPISQSITAEALLAHPQFRQCAWCRRRLAKEAGYEKIITYTLASEPGTTLLAAGWQKAAFVQGKQWTCAGRPRQTRPIFAEDKYRWECLLAAPRPFGQIVFSEREDEVGQQHQGRRDGRGA